MLNKKLTIFLMLCLLGIVLFEVGSDLYASKSSADNKGELGELAYDNNPDLGYTVYLQEGTQYVPYLVLSSNYGGNVLLLRRELLESTMPFNENDTHLWDRNQYGGYYENSSIDKYLNDTYMDRFSQTLQDGIVTSNITITDKSSLGVTGGETAEIARKVFLLSLNELNGESAASVPEGDPLKFFAGDHASRVASLPNGDKSPYWTRTPETWETYTVFTIGPKAIGSGSADIASGVRPAFCLPGTTPIKKRSDLIADQAVYVID